MNSFDRAQAAYDNAEEETWQRGRRRYDYLEENAMITEQQFLDMFSEIREQNPDIRSLTIDVTKHTGSGRIEVWGFVHTLDEHDGCHRWTGINGLKALLNRLKEERDD